MSKHRKMSNCFHPERDLVSHWESLLIAVADPGFARGGPWRAHASLNGGLVAEPPVESRGRAPVGVRGAKPPKAESFLYILYKKWPKVKDLSENLPPCLSRAAMSSPKFWSMEGGRPRSAIAGSAT